MHIKCSELKRIFIVITGCKTAITHPYEKFREVIRLSDQQRDT